MSILLRFVDASIAEFRDEIVNVEKEVDGAMTALDKIVTTAATDPRKAFKNFEKAVPAVDDAVKKAKKRAEDMKSKGQAYFKDWEKELAEVNNTEIRKLAEERKAKLQSTFDSIKSFMEPARDQFNAWLADSKDLQKYLSNDLTIGGIDAAKELIGKTKTEGRAVQQTERSRRRTSWSGSSPSRSHLQCIAGVDGYFKRVNPAFTACLGWSQGELKASPFLDFVHPDDRAATRAEVARLAAAVSTIRFENRYRHRDGSYRSLQWSARTVPGGEQIYATARDVTWEKRLEREILEIGDREREQLGRELHDGLCQTLAGIAALSATHSRSLAKSSRRTASAAAGEIATLLIYRRRDGTYGLIEPVIA